MRTFKTPKGTELPLMDLRGKDYLEVKYRIRWFREEYPLWSIETEYVTRDEGASFAKATIKDESGRIIQTAHKYEDKKGFSDHMEKAETSAVGRALAMIGYGTQFADDFEEGERIVDSPVDTKRSIHPEQPMDADGVHGDQSYRITFGKFNKRSLEEVGPDDLRGYIAFLEKSSREQNKPITGKVLEFIERASDYIASWENSFPR